MQQPDDWPDDDSGVSGFELWLDTALVFVGICIGAICNLWRRDAPSSED